MSVLAVRDVSKVFGETHALTDVALEVAPGEVHALVGGNGSGKSTFLKILAGVVGADRGTLEVGGNSRDLRRVDPKFALRHGLHFVHQQPTIFADMTVAENLCLGHRFDTSLGRIRWRAARARAAGLLERFDIRAAPGDRVGDLPPMTQTMIEIARALQDRDSGREGVLALDEPTAALPPREAQALLETLRRYAAAGQSIVFVSHRLDEVLAVADRVTALRDGRRVATVARGEIDRDGLVELIVGRSVESYFPDPAPPSDRAPMLEVEGLTGGPVRDLSFGVARGEILGIAGLAGAGRSSVLRLLFGAQRPEGGTIRLDGSPVAIRTPADAIRAGIGFVSEDRAGDSIMPALSVAENLSLVDVREYWRGGRIRRGAERAAVAQAMAEFLVRAPGPRAPITALSGGNQQKVALARWLRRRPRLLLLDEPTQGVDVGARAELWSLIMRAAEAGTAVIVVSSDLEELTHLCGRLLVLREGRRAGELAGTQIDPDRVNHMLHQMEAAP
jgi:ribose transport system ATP-binding protein